MYKAMNGLFPKYTGDKITTFEEVHDYDTRHRMDGVIVLQKTEFQRKSIFNSGLSGYNKLRRDLKLAESLQKTPVFLKEFGPIDYIDFSPREPHYFAVTSSVRVQVYSPVTRLLYKNLSRFQKSAYGGSFRNDGRLLCSGGEESAVKLFDVASKSLLRVFKGHTGPVHRCFFTFGHPRIASFSDDASVGVWDIPSEKRLCTFNDHMDYIRAGAVSPVSPDTVLSGGYDNVVKMYDTRSETVVFSVNHDAPVESVLFLPSGGVFISAGGTEIKVWDALAGGRLLARIHQHHKTVTCLRLASNGSRLLSAALDRHVNVYDITNFERIHSINYPNSVLSLGISEKDETLAVGMVDGLVSVSRRETEVRTCRRERMRVHYRFVVEAPRGDVQVGGGNWERAPRYEVLLKKFEHTQALNQVLKHYVVNKTPHVTIAVMKELIARKAMHTALAGSEAQTVVPILKFLIKYIGDVKFSQILIQVADIFLDVYEDSIAECGPTAVELFKRLDDRLKEEIELTQDLLSLEGAMSLLLSVATTVNSPNSQFPSATPLKPSTNAQDFVVNVT